MSAKGDENFKFLTDLANFIEEGGEDELTSGERERGRQFVSGLKLKIKAIKEENRLAWTGNARASLAKAQKILEVDFAAGASRQEMLSALKGTTRAARGLEKSLEQMEDEELIELYREHLQSQQLDDFDDEI